MVSLADARVNISCFGSRGHQFFYPCNCPLCPETPETRSTCEVCQPELTYHPITLHRGPNVFLGYQLEHQNKGLWLYDDKGNRWMNTGDLARQDADGYFWLTGRKKELIVRGGHNIEPKMIEEAMCKHPAINLAAAVGKPDVHAGEVPVCYVQVDASQSVDTSELLAFAAQEVPERAAIPKEIHVVEELPLTAVGKVFKPQLEMQEIEKCVRGLANTELPEQEVNIDVSQDPKLGLLARIEIVGATEELKAHFSRKLGEYIFKSECV